MKHYKTLASSISKIPTLLFGGAFLFKQIIMKKLVLVSVLAIGLFSCQKEPSSCGVIVDDNVKDYSIVIRNSNTGNLKTFYLYPGDWINAHPGEDFCMLNEQEW